MSATNKPRCGLTPNVKLRANLASGQGSADQGARKPVGLQPDATTLAPVGLNVSLDRSLARWD